MRTSQTIHLHGKLTNEQELHLWGISASGESLSATELKLLLLSGDPATFYGAHADIWEEGPIGGVSFGASSALYYLHHPVHNPLLEVDWSDYLRMLREAAEETVHALRSDWIIPSVHSHGITWRLSDEADHERFPILAKQLQGDTQLASWIDACMQVEAMRVPEKRQALNRLSQWHHLRESQESQLEHHQAEQIPEQDLLQLSGWTSPEQPYSGGFRLADPAPNTDSDDGEIAPWTLTYILVDRNQPSIIVECDHTGMPTVPIPDHWPKVLPATRSLLLAWLSAVPFLRDLDKEQATLRSRLDDRAAWTFLTEISEQIADWGGSVLLPAWWNRLRTVRPKLKAELKPSPASGEPTLFGMDQVLDFNWKLAIGDVELSEQEFMSIAEEQKPLHYIRGEWIALDRTLVGQIRKAMERARRKKGMPLRDVLLRQFGKDEGIDLSASDDEEHRDVLDWEIETSGSLLRWMKQLERAESLPQVAVSTHFHGTLRGYQADGLSWLIYLRRFGLGCCLADDMGLGKTIQYITYLLHVKEAGVHQGPSLLICPTSLIGNWQKELERFAPGLRVHLHYGNSREREVTDFQAAVSDCDLILTTYMTALLDIRILQSLTWNSLCLDEAQNMKNAYTKQASAIRRLTAMHRIAMTGTPVENRLSELWSIIDFINPGYLGSLATFERQYGRLAERDKGRAAEQLRRLVRPFILRRMKSDPRIVPDLPDKVEAKVYVPLTKEQAAHYENVLDRLFGGLDEHKGIDRRGRILAALTQLKQICDHPALFTKESGAAAISPRLSHKASRLVEMISELRAEGDRCLIFTQYVEMGNLLVRMLERALKEPVLYLHGGTSKQQRDRMVEQFQVVQTQESSDGLIQPGIFILSLKAGGTGLNLTAASHVFHYDRWWNPAVENQATDRAYRIGQQKLVQVHKFITLGTLEERIDQMIEKKLGLSRDIIDSSDHWITELSTDELHDLFSLRRSWLEG